MNKVTKKMIQDKLRLLNQRDSDGLNHEVRDSVLFRSLTKIQPDTRTIVPPPLAANFKAMDTELDDGEAAGEDEVEEEEDADL
jgi:hypothetical protein